MDVMPTTHEREITRAVDLCLPGGRALAPDAKGWSRVPLHTANLRGGWGRTKRWDYWCVLARDLVVSVTYADVDYIGLANVWWMDPSTGLEGGVDNTLPLARGVSLPDRPGSEPLCYAGRTSSLKLVDDAAGTTITASWIENGQPAHLDVRVELPAGHQSLNVVIPWSDRRFQYTSKHQARPARGTLTVGGTVRTIGPAPGEAVSARTEAWGVLDVGRGRWPYRTIWNWGGGAGRSTDGAVIGLQFGAKWTEGTGFTENGIIVDGRLNKIGDELEWTYEWDRPMQPWRVRHRDGSLDLTLSTTYDRHSRIAAVVLATEVHQVFGTWTGHVTSEDGVRHDVDAILGFAEESRSRW
jgi:hypothetical protein